MKCVACGFKMEAIKDYFWCPDCRMYAENKVKPKVYDSGYAERYLKDYVGSSINARLNLMRLGLVAQYGSGPILDIGCSVGEFCGWASRHFKVSGFDPSWEAITAARLRFPLVDFEYSLEKIKGLFEIVTAFDSFEHDYTPNSWLRWIHGKISSGGFLIITTPNAEFCRTPENVEDWKHWKPGEHVFLYTPAAMEKIFARNGFRLARLSFEESTIRPGNLYEGIMTCVGRRLD